MSRSLKEVQQAIEISGKIAKIAEDTLQGVRLMTAEWPPQLRAIVFRAIADLAGKQSSEDELAASMIARRRNSK